MAMDGYDITDLAGFALLFAYAVCALALRTHPRGTVVHSFVVLSAVNGALKLVALADTKFVSYSVSFWPIALLFTASLSPAVFLAQFALVVRSWASILYSVGDRADRERVVRLFVVVIFVTVVWQFIYVVVFPFTSLQYRVAVVIHHNV